MQSRFRTFSSFKGVLVALFMTSEKPKKMHFCLAETNLGEEAYLHET